MAKKGNAIVKTHRSRRYSHGMSDEWINLHPAKRDGHKYSFEIMGLPPTTNVLNTKHWTQRKDIKDDWQGLIAIILSQVKPSTPYKKAKLTLTRYSARCPDSDGLVGSFKIIIDGLVNCGLLEDDSFKHVGMPTYLWHQSKYAEQKITVLVEGLE